jgi:hypothetical protein
VTRLHCLARYGNRSLGITAQPGDVIEVDADTAALLQRDAPLCWAAEPPAPAPPITVTPPDGPPADRMVSRQRGRPPVRKGG